MSPTRPRNAGRLYRYYVSQAVLKQGRDACPVGRLPAAEIEAEVIDQVRGLMRAPEIVVGTWRASKPKVDGLSEDQVRRALLDLDPLWDELFPAEQARIAAGVALEGPGLEPGLAKLFNWSSTPGGVVQLARGPNGESIALTHDVCGRVVKRRVERKGFRPKTWLYGWDAHDRLVRCDNPEGETWFYRYDPFGQRLTKVRKLADKALAWTTQKHTALVPVAAREATKIWTWPEPPAGSGSPGDTRPPIVGTHFLWDGDVVAEEAPLRLDGTVDWGDATRWHFEPGGFRPLAKQTPDGTLLIIVNDHLGTPREMFDEGGHSYDLGRAAPCDDSHPRQRRWCSSDLSARRGKRRRYARQLRAGRR